MHVSITGEPGHGLLGDLLCSLAGGSNVTSLAQLRSLLSSLGCDLTDAQAQSLLSQLGISDLTAGLSQIQSQQILALLGLGSTLPARTRSSPVCPERDAPTTSSLRLGASRRESHGADAGA